MVDNFVDILLAGADLEAEDLEVVEERGPTLLLDNQVLISGEVPRVTGFEIGFPIHKARAGDGWEPDPLILDDQNLVVEVAARAWWWCRPAPTPARSTSSRTPAA